MPNLKMGNNFDSFFQITFFQRNKSKWSINISLINRKMKIKITMRYHFIPSKMAIIKQRVASVGKGVKKLKLTNLFSENVR